MTLWPDFDDNVTCFDDTVDLIWLNFDLISWYCDCFTGALEVTSHIDEELRNLSTVEPETWSETLEKKVTIQSIPLT